MIIGNVFTENSNGEKSLKLKGMKFSSRAELEKYEKEKAEKTGFKHEVEVVREEKDTSVESESVEIDDEKQEVVSVEDYEFEEDYNKEEFPPVWWKRNEFVARDGTVFKRGEEQPDLYRTKLPDEYETLKDS